MALSLTIKRLLSNQPAELLVFHPVAMKLQEMLAEENFTIEEVIRLINDDPSLATQILKLANSSYYAGRARVETIKDAVVRLGAQQVSNLALAVSQASLHASDNPVLDRFMTDLWHHSHACAIGCRWVAEHAGMRHLAEQAYMSGLLHDVGKLYLLKAVERLTKNGVATVALEGEMMLEIFAELHAEQGARILRHWSLPELYCTVAADHHLEARDPDNQVLAIARLVNAACREAGLSLSSEPAVPLTTLPELADVGLSDLECAELAVVLEDTRADEL